MQWAPGKMHSNRKRMGLVLLFLSKNERAKVHGD